MRKPWRNERWGGLTPCLHRGHGHAGKGRLPLTSIGVGGRVTSGAMRSTAAHLCKHCKGCERGDVGRGRSRGRVWCGYVRGCASVSHQRNGQGIDVQGCGYKFLVGVQASHGSVHPRGVASGVYRVMRRLPTKGSPMVCRRADCGSALCLRLVSYPGWVPTRRGGWRYLSWCGWPFGGIDVSDRHHAPSMYYQSYCIRIDMVWCID